MSDPNTFFSRSRLKDLRGHVLRAAHADERLLRRFAESRIEGLRAWEYGMLLAYLHGLPERGSFEALDVGSGGSAFPEYLLTSDNVGSMTTLDLPDAFERPAVAGGRVQQVAGSMLDMPFEDRSFGLVTCISAIEHLDGNPALHHRDPEAHPMLAYPEYIDRTDQAVRELARVVRPGGHLYLTTDVFLPDRQHTDAWAKGRPGPIRSAYRFEALEQTFLPAVTAAGLELAGRPDFGRALLEDSQDRSTYRGRYFTTFALVARRPRAST
ncbi:MAG: class I SAM-dependent methyltransferase [Thermoleophilaceae bacterium]